MKVGCDGVNWTDFCEDSDEPSGSIKYGEFLD